MTNTITSTEPAGEPAEPAHRAESARDLASRIAWIAAWMIVATLALVTLTRFFGITFPARVTVMLQAIVPIVYLPAYAIGVVALVRKRWFLGAACGVLALVHVAAVYPALGHRSLPAWAATAPRLSILEANVYDQNAEPDAAARTILASGADVLVVVEIDSRTLRSLRQQGIDQAYPYSTLPDGRYRTDVIWSKLPLDDIHTPSGRTDMPSATVVVGDRRLVLLGVHVENAIRDREDWAQELQTLKSKATAATGPVAVVGDFNSTRWNPPFGDLLAAGLHDAHEAVGQGLSRSWPNLGFPVPLMRLDHALVNDHVGVVSVHDVDVPGSDHIGFVTELAVGPSSL
jgi:endonuclease/exonuclease/phosphatase (EEP) superfamily protein YafD